ncbi:MAG: hypothetical protein WB341_03000 [Terracidiphilus sp.]
MNAHDEHRIHEENRIKDLLQQSLPPVGSGELPTPEPARDLWPAVLRRLDSEPTAAPRLLPASLPWFDWALLAGLIGFAAAFPATIPVFLYYL